MNIGRKEYTFLWRIENYSYCWHKNGELLASPEFTSNELENTSWKLQLYPRGKTDNFKSSISLYLTRGYGHGPETFPLQFELSVVAADGSQLHSIKDEFLFTKGTGFGRSFFLEIEEVILRRKSEYLPLDTLSVLCKIWKDGVVMKIGHCSSRTRIGIRKFSFLHKVENFSALQLNEKKCVQIKSDSKTGCIISSCLYFTADSYDEGQIIVEIVPSDCKYILHKLKLFLLDGSGEKIECGKIDNRFDVISKDIQNLTLSLTRTAILNRKGEFLPNGELSLLCECTFSTGIEVEKIEETRHELPMAALKQRCKSVRSQVGYNAAEKLSACSSALADFTEFYKNQLLTDVEIKTKTKSFPAHKLVLCSRSPVFKAMLTNDMKEKNSACIQVDDLENDIVQQLLLFLYSDNLQNLEWESAMKIYYASDKYEIKKLKVICSSFLVDNLSTSTASELLLLADTHNDSDLKNSVENFISEHEDDVFGSDEWEMFTETNPQLAVKTMHLKYKRKKFGK